jgi:hypothetical protein
LPGGRGPLTASEEVEGHFLRRPAVVSLGLIIQKVLKEEEVCVRPFHWPPERYIASLLSRMHHRSTGCALACYKACLGSILNSASHVLFVERTRDEENQEILASLNKCRNE